ncbi:glycosyltransferase family 2 protein [Anthocerotibacter panamensis]|uniref:glycosyltransferase family 2 protein n=1 Tax=Anthocerotibacter panamensis TaxID=2857077 RepID=UPI001C4083F2|nr:glycosyltransferase [Anthocerotibacter panamensis]
MNPQLSVVIASINGWSYLSECLRALAKQTGDIPAEIIVADCIGPQVTDRIAAAYPEVHLISFRESRSVAQLRAAAIAIARGEIIAITEDHCIPPSDWYTSVLQAHANHSAPAIGGAVDNGATERLIDWAVFFCEYSTFISPMPLGVVHDLPGPNVSYKQSALVALGSLIKEEFWETSVHSAFEQCGQPLWSDPTVRVIHKKHFTLQDFLSERYHYSRAYAGGRNAALGPGKRLVYFLGSPLLAPLMLTRISQRVLTKKRHLGTYLRTLPYLGLFLLAWVVGEAVGYALGPGDSALYLS